MKGEKIVNHNLNQVFCNRIALPHGFSITELYNTNRESSSWPEMVFLDKCFKAGFFDIHKFEINTDFPIDTDQRKRRMEIRRLMEYSRENEMILESLWNLIQVIKQSKLEVLEEGMPCYVRAYVPAWKLIISPSTQSITGILQMLNQTEQKICIVTTEGYYENEEKTITYLIECKTQFNKVYKAFLREKQKQQDHKYNLFMN